MVVGVVALFISGPIGLALVAIALVAGAVVLADTLSKFARGQASLGQLAMDALGVIPGGRGVITVAKLGKGAKLVGGALRRGGAVRQTGGEFRRVYGDLDFETRWADEAYDVIRSRDGDVDVDNIFDTVSAHGMRHGPDGFSRQDIADIRQHVFFDEHALDRYGEATELARFDANPRMAEAWDRLSSGNPHPSDWDLLRHERYELNWMRNNGTRSYSRAHGATLKAGYHWDSEAATRAGFGWLGGG